MRDNGATKAIHMDDRTVEAAAWDLLERAIAAPTALTDAPVKLATAKQVDYAISLVSRYWDDADATQGLTRPTRATLSTMTSREVSDLISALRSERIARG
jgi:hypothetical protein